jgi:hypothetical protein
MKVLFVLAATAACFAGPVYADCSYPPPPEHLPDGNTATMAEMIEGQKAVKAYDGQINAYNSCIVLERDNAVAKAAEKMTPEQKAKMQADMDKVVIQKHNAAVDQLQSVADRFNEQVRVFKAKTSGDTSSDSKKKK